MSSEPDLSQPRRGPRPASDETVDSAEVTRAATKPPSVRPVGRPRRAKPEPVIQFSTRLAQSYRDAIDAVVDTTGNTVREIIEDAIRNTYPEFYKDPAHKSR